MLLNSELPDQYVLHVWWVADVCTNIRTLGLSLVLFLLVLLDAIAVFDVVRSKNCQ